MNIPSLFGDPVHGASGLRRDLASRTNRPCVREAPWGSCIAGGCLPPQSPCSQRRSHLPLRRRHRTWSSRPARSPPRRRWRSPPTGGSSSPSRTARLRVIKNGALLATPFLTVPVTSTDERGLLGVTFDPNFATNRFVYVYYTAASPVREPRQPLHGQRLEPRRRRGRQRAGRSSTTSRRSPATTTAGRCTSGPTASSTSRSARTTRASNAQSTSSLTGQAAPDQRRRVDPGRQPVLRQATGRTGRSGRSACATRSRSTSSGRPAGSSSTTSARARWEEINEASTQHRRHNFGWPTTEGPTTRPALQDAVPLLHARRRALRDHRRRVLRPGDRELPAPSTSATTSSPTSAPGWIKSIDLTTKAVSTLLAAERVALAGRHRRRRGRQPLLPRARAGPASTACGSSTPARRRRSPRIRSR